MVRARSTLEFKQEAVEHADEALALYLETFDELRKSIPEEQGQTAHASSRYPGNNAAAVSAMHHRQPLPISPKPARPEILADITCVPTREGWLYLAAALDLFDQEDRRMGDS